MSPPKELAIKKRSAANLTQFVKTRTSEVPNYTMLLGAGASVTSDVRSARELVEIWRKEVFHRIYPDEMASYDPEAAVSLLTRQHGDWYTQQREYSSLFERMFDLPRQRRMFVENEVSGKQPSMGYSYLIRLIEENFFNTVFTTNFDDLLNESFHQFSDLRPIVCAHDSSISSITVTSKRPKIIKLHGDYLFDDIKSTVRETESLEENTKRKFIEFAKDHGLIVVGYSGTDRSIMDVLHFLLKQDDYFKHGIYWCLRPGDIPSDELTKLLWKDRVFWVEVEGFDELMAQLHQECVGQHLPVSTSVVTQKPLDVIARFCNDRYLQLSPSKFIQRDIGRLRQELDQESLVNSLRTLTRGRDDEDRAPNKIRDRDGIKLMEIRKLVELKDYELSLQKLSTEIATSDYLEYKSELLLTKLEVEEEKEDFKGAVQTCDILLEEDPNNAYYFLRRSLNERDQSKRLGSVARAIELDPYYSYAHRMRANFLEHQLAEDAKANESELVAAILADYEKSLGINPGMQNSSWSQYVSFLTKYRHLIQDASTKVDDCFLSLEQMDAQSPLYFSIRYRWIVEEEKSQTIKDEFLGRLNSAIVVQPVARRKALELLRLEVLKAFGMRSELIAALVSFDSDGQWIQDSKYIRFRARAYAEVEGKLFDAIRTLEAYKRVSKDEPTVRLLVKYLCFARRTNDAQNFLDQCRAILNDDDRSDLQEDIDSANGHHDRVLASIRNTKSTAIYEAGSALFETHTLIKLGQFEEAERAARNLLGQAHFSLRFATLIINFELASLHLHRKVDKPRLNKVAQYADTDPLTRMCAFLLLDDRAKAAEEFEAAVRKDKTAVYTVADWAIWDVLSNRAWRDEFLRSHGMGEGLALFDLRKAS
jgi:NAD-dependent SIR2 family protein deacetylase